MPSLRLKVVFMISSGDMLYRNVCSHSKSSLLSGAQAVFSYILPLGNWDPGRRRRTEQVNVWLCGWCHTQGFGFSDLGHTLDRPGMLTSDGPRLAEWDKAVLGSNLVGFISRNLN